MDKLLSTLTQVSIIENQHRISSRRRQDQHREQTNEAIRATEQKFVETGFDQRALIATINTLSNDPKELKKIMSTPAAKRIVEALHARLENAKTAPQKTKLRDRLIAMSYLTGTSIEQIEATHDKKLGQILSTLPKALTEAVCNKIESQIDKLIQKKELTEPQKAPYTSTIYYRSVLPRTKAKAIKLALRINQNGTRRLSPLLGSEIRTAFENPKTTPADRDIIVGAIKVFLRGLSRDINKARTMNAFSNSTAALHIKNSEHLLDDLARPVRIPQCSTPEYLERIALPCALLHVQALKKQNTRERVIKSRSLLKITVRKHLGAINQMHAQGKITDRFYNKNIQKARRFGLFHLLKAKLINPAQANRQRIAAQEISQ